VAREREKYHPPIILPKNVITVRELQQTRRVCVCLCHYFDREEKLCATCLTSTSTLIMYEIASAAGNPRHAQIFLLRDKISRLSSSVRASQKNAQKEKHAASVCCM